MNARDTLCVRVSVCTYVCACVPNTRARAFYFSSQLLKMNRVANSPSLFYVLFALSLVVVGLGLYHPLYLYCYSIVHVCGVRTRVLPGYDMLVAVLEYVHVYVPEYN